MGSGQRGGARRLFVRLDKKFLYFCGSEVAGSTLFRPKMYRPTLPSTFLKACLYHPEYHPNPNFPEYFSQPLANPNRHTRVVLALLIQFPKNCCFQ